MEADRMRPIYQATHASHGIIPEHMVDKLVARYEAKGQEHIVERIQQQRKIQLELLKDRHETSRAALKENRELLPDGQVLQVYSSLNTQRLKYSLKRASSALSPDKTVNEAYDGAEATYNFLKTVFKISSIDGKHFDLISNVHFGFGYSNAFWNGSQMVYGDGDGKYFYRFTKDLDISAHEQTHGLTDFMAGTKTTPTGQPTGINYEGEAGGINEGYSDIFGIMVKQWKNQQTAHNSSWLIGETIFIPKNGRSFALRSMTNPGTAYTNHPAFGNDPQIDHYAEYQALVRQGAVDPHISSGIVNKAFATSAINYGGNSWDRIGQIFGKALGNIVFNETFSGLAKKTISVAVTDFKEDAMAYNALMTAWRGVGVIN